ncbi:MAG: YaaA family protein [Owenweeksia sp.]|nr:YaaA family protein [Owenweeksia sp.]
MIVLLSPAEVTSHFETSQTIGRPQQPALLEDAKRVNQKLRKQSRKKLRSLQNISSQLAELNYGRNQQWDADHSQGAKQAALAFTGDVYQGLMASEWSAAEMDFANEHLRISSGLYGLLRPV